MARYPCIFKTDEQVDAAPLYEEFLATCASELQPAYADESAWTGVRVFDLRGVDRLDELPVLRARLDEIGREHVTMVNFYNMAPGSSQHAHRDQSGNLLFGISRIHTALRTNPDAFLEVERRRYHLPVGEVWCLDTSGLHAARNGGSEGRVHLVVDVKRAPATERYFPTSSLATRLHLTKFVAIMGTKVARDVVTKPRTLLDRLPYLRGLLRRRPSAPAEPTAPTAPTAQRESSRS